MAIKFKRGTKAAWLASNIILQDGQPGIAMDTGDLRVGDGVHTWSTLPDPKVAKTSVGNTEVDLVALYNAAKS